MRVLFSGFLAAALLAGHTAAAECARPTERAAFDVAELKSELMVTALTCKSNTQYNAFVTRYRPDLLAHEKAVSSYFARIYGRHGQTRQDDYVTSLANAQTQQGIKKGTGFCAERGAMFDEVMALPSPRDLPDYAKGKDLATPIPLVACSTAEPADKPAARTMVRQIVARKAVPHKH